MSQISFTGDTLSLKELREELAVEISPGTADTISIDIYGPEKKHPEGHFGYWNYKLPPHDSRISVKMNFNRIAFNSVSCFREGKLMNYKDHWINPEFAVTGHLNVYIILWGKDKPVETRAFGISLDAATINKLQGSLEQAVRLDKNSRFLDHFCNDTVPLPKLLVLESTSRCNLKCPMCPRTIDKSPSGEYGDLDESILANLAGAFRETESVCLSWMGEPLLNKRLPAIIQKIKQINPAVSISITSNGTLLTEEAAAGLINSGLDSINISIDAEDPEIYRETRVGAELEKVKSNINTLNRLKHDQHVRKPDICIAYVAGRNNISQMPAMINMAEALGINHVSLAMMDDFTLTDAYEDRTNLAETTRATGRKAFEETERSASEKGIGLVYEMPIQFFHSLGISRPGYEVDDILFNNKLSNSEIVRLGMQKGCHVPWLNAFVAHNGDVHPCCVSPRVLGNLGQNTFEEIWNGAKYRDFRRKLKSSDTNDECRRCKRAIWNKIPLLESAKDWMETGRSELHGLGWGPAGTDKTGRNFRVITRKATFFLRNSGKRFLSVTLGNEGRNIASCRIFLNDREIGSSIIPYGWQTEHFDIPEQTGKQSPAPDENQDVLFKIDITVSSVDTPIKITSAYLLAEDELDRQTIDNIKTKTNPLDSLVGRITTSVKQAGYYTDKIRKRLRI